MPHANADRNLLFGILALQLNFITRDQLVAAMVAGDDGRRENPSVPSFWTKKRSRMTPGPCSKRSSEKH